ncbi:hypothetical protein A4S05_00480 [Nostoc sp. KVJ20]|nr:hypothetical protein A4S05_00480 [Nostoc sp. KVJ20]
MKFGTKIGDFNLQKAQNLSRGFKMLAMKQRIFVGHLERASPIYLFIKCSSDSLTILTPEF